MESFEQWAREQGCGLVSLATRRAAGFYQTLEYKEVATSFRKVLNDRLTDPTPSATRNYAACERKPFHLRALTPVDAPAYRTMRLRSLREWPPAFGTPAGEEERLDPKKFEARLEATRDGSVIGAFDGVNLAGFVRLSRYSGSNEAHRAYLAGLYVEPEYRGQGYGRALVRHAIDLAEGDETLRRLNLTVVSGQRSAIAIYRSLGFVSYGIEEEAFEAGGRYFDEILMKLPLRKDSA